MLGRKKEIPYQFIFMKSISHSSTDVDFEHGEGGHLQDHALGYPMVSLTETGLLY